MLPKLSGDEITYKLVSARDDLVDYCASDIPGFFEQPMRIVIECDSKGVRVECLQDGKDDDDVDVMKFLGALYGALVGLDAEVNGSTELVNEVRMRSDLLAFMAADTSRLIALMGDQP